MIPQSVELSVITQTVLLEAEAEPYLGKLAVAYTIINRMDKHHLPATYVCWQPWQFSCWLDDLTKISSRFAKAPQDAWTDSLHAADQAFHKSIPDPTQGATHYLNEELTKQIRGGTLPTWVASMTHTVKIGLHDFYKE